MLATAGERVAFDGSLRWVEELVAEGASGELRALREPGDAAASLRVRVEAERRPFDTRRWELIGRGVFHKGDELVVQNVCAVGFDLRLRGRAETPEFTYRWVPGARERVAARLLRSRFHLLARAVLVQYPALWAAGSRGRVPLHASALATDGSVALVTAPSGVGRSTLVLAEVAAGARATGDNLAVGDGERVWGLVEPVRVSGGGGRAMPHGRSERALPGRATELVPDAFVVLKRGVGPDPVVASCAPVEAARSLTTSTYAAGELRRYWAFAAILTGGTGIGPPHPPVHAVATAFASRLPCFSLELGAEAGTRLPELRPAMEVACA